MIEDMKAVIMAGGKSTRLRPLTDHLPKCLLKIDKKRIIDYQIQPLLKNNINQIIVVIGYEGEKIIDHLTSNYPEVKFSFVNNPIFHKTKAAYGLWLARHYLNSDWLYFNGDLVFDPSILKRVLSDKRENLIPIQRVAWDEEEVKVILDKDLQIKKISKKIGPQLSSGEFVGLGKFGKDFTKNLLKTLEDMINKKEYQKFFIDSVDATIQNYQETVFALDVTDLPAIEVDFPEDFKKAKELIVPKIEDKI